MKKIKYNLPIDVINQIYNNEELILRTLETLKYGKTQSTQKHYVYRKEEFLYFAYTRNELKHLTFLGANKLQQINYLSTKHKVHMYKQLMSILKLKDYFNDSEQIEMIREVKVKKTKSKSKSTKTISASKAIEDELIDENNKFEIGCNVSFNKNEEYFEMFNDILRITNNQIKKLQRDIKKTNNKIKLQKLNDKLDGKKKLRKSIRNANKDNFFNDLNPFHHFASRRRQTKLSTIKKEFRNFILINGEVTIIYDIKNSQPVFFANKYKKYLTEETYNYMIDGTFYDIIANELDISRGKAKKIWMNAAYWEKQSYTIYGDEASITNNYSYRLSKIFPDLAELIDNLKRKGIDINAELQFIEAEAVNKISDILKENDVPNLTTYDEFIIRISDKNKFKFIFNNYLTDNNIKLKLSSNEIYDTINLEDVSETIETTKIENNINILEKENDSKNEDFYDRFNRILNTTPTFNEDGKSLLEQHFNQGLYI